MRLFKNTKQIIIWVITFILAVAAFYFSTIYGNKAAKEIKDTVEPVLTLTTDKVLLKVGDDFDVMSYIDTATNKYGEDITDKIKAPEIPTDVPGTYDIVYQYFDGRDLIKSKTLKVIIAEKVASDTSKSDEKQTENKTDTADGKNDSSSENNQSNTKDAANKEEINNTDNNTSNTKSETSDEANDSVKKEEIAEGD